MGKLLLISVFCFIILQKQSDGAATRVIGGFEAELDFKKYHASLQNLTGHHVCGGAVISKQHIITAAHCMNGADPQYVKIVVGTTDLDVGGAMYDVSSIEIYNDFNFSARTHDIAVLKAVEPFNPLYVDIIKFDDNKVVEGDVVTLTGFGALEPNGASSRTMHVLNLSVFSQETCQYAMRYTREVYDTMFCTFTQIGEGTCHGDSGGPLVKNDQLVGLVSWGIPCAIGYPDVHTRVAPYADWITSIISSN